MWRDGYKFAVRYFSVIGGWELMIAAATERMDPNWWKSIRAPFWSSPAKVCQAARMMRSASPFLQLHPLAVARHYVPVTLTAVEISPQS